VQQQEVVAVAALLCTMTRLTVLNATHHRFLHAASLPARLPRRVHAYANLQKEQRGRLLQCIHKMVRPRLLADACIAAAALPVFLALLQRTTGACIAAAAGVSMRIIAHRAIPFPRSIADAPGLHPPVLPSRKLYTGREAS
jgi:hypothetical protein